MKGACFEMTDFEMIERPVKRLDIKDLTIEFLVNFYLRNEKHDKYVLLIYKDEEYLTAFSINSAHNCVNEKTMKEKLSNLYHGAVPQDVDEGEIEKKFYYGHDVDVILVSGTERENAALFLQYKSIDYIEVACLRNRIKVQLRNQGVNAWTCRIPGDKSMKRNLHFAFHLRLLWADCYRKELEQVLPDYTENDYDTEKKAMLAEKKKDRIFPSGKPVIYLVGPCIVNGMTIGEDEDLASLFEKYVGCQYQGVARQRGGGYEIRKVVELNQRTTCFTSILKYTIRKCDVVIFLSEFPGDMPVDLDLTEKFCCEGKRKLYMDKPIHTTKWGNEMIVSEILSKIIEPHNAEMRTYPEEQAEILYAGEPFQLTYSTYEKLEKYIEEIRRMTPAVFGIKAAIVMNANPFTLGHRYLVEYASKKVDFLYLFVVEEDAAEIPFMVRKRLVERGIADIKNVAVIPSGSFVISRETFISYFEKEQNRDEEIDASFDCCIFAQYIAPKLGITKRFVGEEPYDLITRQYNQQMKEIFPKYGIELVEIPRKVFGDKAISASRVRILYKERQWEELRKLVPYATYSCLHEQDGRAWNRGEKDYACKKALDMLLDIRQKQREGLKSLRQFFKTGCRVVIYGIGQDTDILLKHLSEKLLDEVVFCDKKAADKEIWYHGKRVLTPECIQTDDFVYIATTRYKEEIYENLLNKGINKNRIGIIDYWKEETV